MSGVFHMHPRAEAYYRNAKVSTVNYPPGRICTRCNQRKTLRGGTFTMGRGRSFVCADCKVKR